MARATDYPIFYYCYNVLFSKRKSFNPRGCGTWVYIYVEVLEFFLNLFLDFLKNQILSLF